MDLRRLKTRYNDISAHDSIEVVEQYFSELPIDKETRDSVMQVLHQNKIENADYEIERLKIASFFKPWISESTDDGDQSPVHGSEVQRLRYFFATGLDWNPCNPLASNWMKVLGFGDHKKMMSILSLTPKSKRKFLIEQRETQTYSSALFHLSKGAMHYSQKRVVDDKYIKCLTVLLHLGANVHAKDFVGNTPLFYCFTKFSNPTTMQMGKILLAHGADVNAQNRIGETPLRDPAFAKRLDCVKLLLDHGADPTIRNNDGEFIQRQLVVDLDVGPLILEARKNNSKNIRASKQKDGLLKCASCPKVGTSRCIACHLTWYCGKECQKKHWKKHRSQCKKIRKQYEVVEFEKKADSSVTVTFNYMYEIPVNFDQFKPDKRSFVVKIQIDYEPEYSHSPTKIYESRLRLYNKNFSVSGCISKNQDVYQKIFNKIEKEGLYGDKAFFHTIVDDDQNFRINVEHMLAPRTW